MTLDTFDYTLDNVGNRLSRTDGDYQSAYTYDAAYRLTQSQPSQVTQSPTFFKSTESFTYDAVGNRLTAPSYPKASTYLQSYAYDYENRLVTATRQTTGNSDADTVTFKYDPFGRRIEKNVSTYEAGTLTTYNYVYVYDNEDIILEVLNKTQNGTTTTTTTAYTHGPGIDEPLSLIRGGQTDYYHADGLGSITTITDSLEAAVNRYAYDSFGAIDKSEGIRNAYTYTGREYDSETGLYYYRARYYDPEAGRFVSKDPIGFGGGDVNVYGYVLNNPVMWVDPWGLWHCVPGANCDFTRPMEDALACFDRCTGRDNEITSGRRPGGGQHGRGQACDMNRTNNPDLSRDDAARCRAECFSHGYGQEERNGPNSSDPNGTHLHLQLNTVPGGQPGFAPNVRPYQPSPPR